MGEAVAPGLSLDRVTKRYFYSHLGRTLVSCGVRHASLRDPKNWQYRAYMAAIAFRKKGDAEMVREQLRPVVDDPDCPTMIKHIVAYLDRRSGRREEATRLYRSILSSRDKSYQGLARRALLEMGAPEAP